MKSIREGLLQQADMRVGQHWMHLIGTSCRPAADPPRLAKMAPASATLTLCPTTRPVARKPEALPWWPRGAAPINALLLGDWNKACPAPVKTKRQIISNVELCAFNWLINT